MEVGVLALPGERLKEIIDENKRHDNDTGSSVNDLKANENSEFEWNKQLAEELEEIEFIQNKANKEIKASEILEDSGFLNIDNEENYLNEEANIEEAELFVKEIRVDSGSMLKRLRPAPQGRAHRIRKRSNHVTLVLGANNNTQSN